MEHDLPVAVLSNGSTFTPDKVDALVEMGPISYLSINISSLDRERYAAERQKDHLPMVLSNLDYMKDKSVAETMDIIVLGQQDEQHRADAAELREHFAGSRFNVTDPTNDCGAATTSARGRSSTSTSTRGGSASCAARTTTSFTSSEISHGRASTRFFRARKSPASDG